MTRTAESIIHDALALDADDRIEIAARLIASIDADTDPDPGYEAAWEAEIKRRIDELDNGTVQCIPWEDVRKRLRARFERDRGH